MDPENGGTSSSQETKLGSGFGKQERSSDSGEDQLRASKMVKTMSLHQGASLLRSNSGDSRSREQMLSFSGVKSETSSGGFGSFQQIPTSYTRNPGYGSGSLNPSMHGTFTGVRAPFTPSQWIELEHQALIYKYINENVPVPSNLLIPLKKSLYPYGLSSSAGSLPPHSLGWGGTFHLGYSGSTDPEPGRCRRTDGKKWRCSRDAVADQKYCERHINRGRHRSRKPVEGQTGHAPVGTTNNKAVPLTSSTMSTYGGASNNLATTHHPFKTLQSDAASNPTLVNRMQDLRGISMMSSATNPKANDSSTFTITKQGITYSQMSQLDFGHVASDSLVNPSHRSPFLDFKDQDSHDQNPLHQFIDDWPKDLSSRSVLTWPDELKSDWTQLSMSIPMTKSEFSSSSPSPTQDRLALSPLRLSREFDPVQTCLGVSNDLSEPNQKQANWIPIPWGHSMGGPLGEVLTTTTNNSHSCNNSSALNLLPEAWDGSPPLGSSPAGVLQKSTFASLSSSSSGSSPIAEHKISHESDTNLCDDMLGSTLMNSFSIPSIIRS